MAKFFQIEGRSKSRWFFECPGCDCLHSIDTPRWTFNGDPDNPTVTPSLVIKHSDNVKCHLFVRDGKIEFLNDSTHALKGRTVEIPLWSD